MAYRYDKTDQSIVIDGFEKGIASSPYTGISNMRNVGISYYPSVAYVNYKRQACTLAESGTFWYAGAHSINVSDNTGWIFEASPGAAIMTNPIQHATSPSGLNYILDDTGQIWKQSAVNSSTFNLLGDSGRFQNGAGGLAYWNNYLAVIGNGMIEFCGNGTGDAAIISGNWNLTSSPSTVTVVSQLLFMNSFYSSESYAFTATPSSGATSANLNSNWVGVSGTYVVEFNNSNQDQRNVVFTNGAAVVTWSGGLSVNCVDNTFMMYQLRVIDGSSFVGSTLFTAGSAVQFSSSGTLPANISANTTYYLIQTVDLQTDHTFFVAGSTAGYVNNRFITINSAGSGTITMSLLPPTNPPIQNTTITGFTWGTNGSGSTSLTLATLWTYATGIWNIVDTLGNQIQASFVYDSSIVSLINPASYQSAPSGTFQVNILNPSPSTTSQAPYRFWVSKVDGNLYFANGRWVGRVSDSINTNVTFNPSIPSSYSVSYAATGTLQPQDVVNDMTDLRGQMIIAGNYDIYPWDYVSSQPSSSSPVGELIYRITNLLNNIYIIAGQKGNIYVSNGATAQLLYKIPDYIAGIIDPVWQWGSLMTHRGKLYIQSLVKNTSGTNILAGIFSFNVSATLVTDIETSGAFTMEAQNSYGLTPSSNTKPNGVLIDNEPSSNGQDSYYSAYSNGSGVGGIDYNSTALWGNFEPTIETDIIPIGSFFDKETNGQIEFKLDRPLTTGDSIKLYARQSLSDTYVQIGQTFNNLQLSDAAVSNIFQYQWVQFMIKLSCANSGSSFVPLREIRIHQD